jgi:predicted O-methyltransferase YrrM
MWFFLFLATTLYNFFHRRSGAPAPKSAEELYHRHLPALQTAGTDKKTLLPLLEEIRARALKRTDISDHLADLFAETAAVRPQLIVELGVRGGESTFVLERAAALSGAALVSLDIRDCRRVSAYKRWHFIKEDDITFAGRFRTWCEERGLAPAIDVLFIDTSHLYEHTVQEIRHWFPHLAPHAKVFFHDTCMGRTFRRRDGTRGVGWENRRGVIRAIEEYLGARLDETSDFIREVNGWNISHSAACNGFTLLAR